MKKYLILSLLALFVLNLAGLLAFGQETKAILDKMIEATGGRKALEAIKDTSLSGSMELTQMGISGVVTFYHKEPNMLRSDIEVMGYVFSSSFDGEVAWMVNPETGAVEDLPADAHELAENEAMGFGFSWLLSPEKYGIAVADKGKETIEGKEYIVLEQTYKNGRVSTYYIDSGTYLTYKMVNTTMNQMGFEVEQETVMQDYKKANGINFAHTIVIYQDGEEFGSMIVEELKFNTGLEDSLFKKQSN
jgi:outer membrane lipoprotein-sorting protein